MANTKIKKNVDRTVKLVQMIERVGDTTLQWGPARIICQPSIPCCYTENRQNGRYLVFDIYLTELCGGGIYDVKPGNCPKVITSCYFNYDENLPYSMVGSNVWNTRQK